MCIRLLFVLMLASAGIAHAQDPAKAAKLYAASTRDINTANYKAAEAKLLQALQADATNTDVLSRLADVQIVQREDVAARQTLRRLIAALPQPEFAPYLKLEQMELDSGHYAAALPCFEKVGTIKNVSYAADMEAKLGASSCRFALTQNLNARLELAPLTYANSPDKEYMPIFQVDGKVLVFTRVESAAKGGENLYVSRRVQGAFSKATLMPEPLNSPMNEGAHTLAPDGASIIFTACDRPNGLGSCDLFISTRNGNAWSIPKNLGEAINTGAWESQPTISADGKRLIFCSNRAGGKGGADLYESLLLPDGTWSDAKNMRTINTRKDDNTPYLHPDGETLYFSSNGLPGMGKRDVFVCRLKNGTWQAPENLGFPVNTFGDENSMTVSADGTEAYYATDRKTTNGNLDLYSFPLPKAAQPNTVTYLSGRVHDRQTNTPLQADFTLTDVDNGQTYYNGHSDASTGEFLVALPAGHTFALEASRKGYMLYSEAFAMPKLGLMPEDRKVDLLPIRPGFSVALRNVFFPTGSADLSRRSFAELDLVAQWLLQNPTTTLDLRGHTDNVGKPTDNQTLSERRAAAVMTYLVTKGVPATRLRASGFGDTDPIAPNTTDDNRAKNRRTDAMVLTTDGNLPRAIPGTKLIPAKTTWQPLPTLSDGLRLYSGPNDEKAYYGTVLAFGANAQGAKMVLLKRADASFAWVLESNITKQPLFIMADDAALLDLKRTVIR